MVRRRRSQSSLATKLVLIVNQGLMLPGKQRLAHSFLERNGPFVRFLRVASPGIRVQTVNNVSTPRDQDALLAQRCEPLADRKSTRLNSSHITISYAVFCLKKNTSTTCDPAPAHRRRLLRT